MVVNSWNKFSALDVQTASNSDMENVPYLMVQMLIIGHVDADRVNADSTMTFAEKALNGIQTSPLLLYARLFEADPFFDIQGRNGF